MQGNGDYISSEAVTTLFARACGECKEACEEFDGFYADCNQCLLHGVLKAFAKLPAADVRPVVRARWIDTDNYYQRWKCSACGCHTRDAAPNFCPNCGADMRPPKEG